MCVFDFDFMQNLGRRDLQGSPLCWHEPRSLPSQRRIPITRSLASRDSSRRAARGLPLPRTLNLGFDVLPVAVVPTILRRLTAKRKSAAAGVLAAQHRVLTPRSGWRRSGRARRSRSGGRGARASPGPEPGRGVDSCSGSRGRAPPSRPPSPRLTYYPLLLLPLLFQNTRRREQNTMPPHPR